MRLYLDTADRAAAEPLLATGLFAGITTNPTILTRAALTVDDIPDVHRWALAAGAREVFFQAWGTEVGALVERGRHLRGLGPEVVVKLVASQAGAAACAALAADGVPTLLTAVYHPVQAIVAAAAGAGYIAPYVGKLQDSGRDAVAEVRAMHEALTAGRSTTRILLASVRDLPSVVTFARMGVEHFTLSPAVASRLFTDGRTARAAADFEAAAAVRHPRAA